MFHIHINKKMNTVVIAKIITVEECKAYKGFTFIKVNCSKAPTLIELYKALSSIEKKNPITFEKAMGNVQLYIKPDKDYTDRSKLVYYKFSFGYANYLALKNMVESRG